MRRICRVGPSWLVFVVLPCWWLIAVGSAQCEASPTGEANAEEWASDNDSRALDLLFGPICPTDETYPTDLDWMVTVRATPAYALAAEYEFKVSYSSSGEVRVDYSRLNSPLLSQIALVHGAAPGSYIGAIVAKVGLEDFSFSSKEAGASLRRIATSLRRLRIPLALESAMVLDSRHYEVCVSAGAQELTA